MRIRRLRRYCTMRSKIRVLAMTAGQRGYAMRSGNAMGRRVLDIVDACTDADTEPKPPWRERKDRYIGHIAEMSNDAVLVSLADKLHNARAILNDYRMIEERLWVRFNGGRDGTLWYYNALVEAFSLKCDISLTGELRKVVEELNEEVSRS